MKHELTFFRLLLVAGFLAVTAFAQEPEPDPDAKPEAEKPEETDPKKSRMIQGGDDPAFSNLPKGSSLGDIRARSSWVPEKRPERVPVYPEDPKSAWWEINPSYAFKRAEREQKPLMLLFTSDTNTISRKLSQEVFATKSFNDYVKENLVICYLNYPRSIVEATKEMRALKERFKIRGYPNVLVFNPKGEIDAHITGYRTGRPVDYFNSLKGKIQPVLQKIEIRKKEATGYGFRDWKGENSDLTIFARFLRRDTELVTLQGLNREMWTIPLEKLAEKDRAMAKSFPEHDVSGTKKK